MNLSEFKTVLIPINKRRWAVVDIQDASLVLKYTWHRHVGKTHKTGYARSNQNPKIYMHRLILGISDKSVSVDHADGNGLNNVRANLRPASHILNAANQCGHKDNVSGFKGVTWNKRKKNWMARLNHEGNQYWLGAFVTAEEAALAYNEAAIKHFGEFARINHI